MPRLSMWKDGRKTNDYHFIDKLVFEQFTVGATSILLHKYLGPGDSGITGDATQPTYAEQSVTNIQDILFLENRDRKYDPDVYTMRGAYQRSDSDFDLSQFGLFLTNNTIFMTWHYNDMIARIGRKIMNGDVIELLHLKDDDVLDTATALKRFYVVGDCSFATEGFSATWFPHLWRGKLTPIVDSQEYKDILKNITAGNNAGPLGTSTGDNPLVDIMSTYNKYIAINEAVLTQADAEVPLSGYDTSKIYTKPVRPDGPMGEAFGITADIYNTDTTADELDASNGRWTPDKKVKGYLSGDGTAPNGLPVGAGVAFPGNPELGDYFLRLDYLPNRLFRFDGKVWRKVEDKVRTNLTPGNTNNETLRNSFANNTDTITVVHPDGTQHEIPSRQSLSDALRPPVDY
jgi:hypothetical protein